MNAQLVLYIGKKIAHFVREFQTYAPEVGEFDSESETRDVIIRNPLCPEDDSQAMYIEFGEEFTVYWHGHRYFSPEDYWYDMMVEYVHDILEGRTGYIAFCDDTGKVLMVSDCRTDKIRDGMTAEDIAVLFRAFSGDENIEFQICSAAVCRIYVWGRETSEIPMK